MHVIALIALMVAAAALVSTLGRGAARETPVPVRAKRRPDDRRD